MYNYEFVATSCEKWTHHWVYKSNNKVVFKDVCVADTGDGLFSVMVPLTLFKAGRLWLHNYQCCCCCCCCCVQPLVSRVGTDIDRRCHTLSEADEIEHTYAFPLSGTHLLATLLSGWRWIHRAGHCMQMTLKVWIFNMQFDGCSSHVSPYFIWDGRVY